MTNFKLLIVFTSICLLGLYSCDDNLTTEKGNQSTALDIRQQTIEGWTPRECADLTIFISPECGQNMATGVQNAMDAYNATNTSIDMSFANSELDADIVITCGRFADPTLAGLAEFPVNDGEIGAELFLNTDFENACDDPCYFQGLVMHEFGHNLGLFHNEERGTIVRQAGPVTFNPNNGTFTVDNLNTSVTTSHIPDTDNSGGDKGSIFNRFILDCEFWNFDTVQCSFSDDDIKALEYLYPKGDCGDDEVSISSGVVTHESECPCPPGQICRGGRCQQI